jgi:hypothetical protein
MLHGDMHMCACDHTVFADCQVPCWLWHGGLSDSKRQPDAAVLSVKPTAAAAAAAAFVTAAPTPHLL